MKVKITNWQKLMASLSEAQKERIKAKCSWEHMSWLGVLADWPDLFINNKNKELVALIQEGGE